MKRSMGRPSRAAPGRRSAMLRRLSAVGFALAWLAAGSVLAADPPLPPIEDLSAPTRVDAPVKPSETLRFDQEKALANLRELEDRMMRLGDLLRDAKPEDSARLLLGVQRAREELIAEQMQEASGLLAKLDLERAASEQQEVIVKLERLRELLLNADIDLTLKLAQLRQLRQLRESLGQLIANEQRQLDQTEGSPSDPEPLEEGERRNERSAESLSQQMRSQLGEGQAAATCVAEGGQAMGTAAARLGESKCDAATESQRQAIDRLQEGDRKLDELQRRLREEVESGARQRVMELVKQLLDQQTKVREGTERAAGREADEVRAALLRRLASAQADLAVVCAEAREIAELAEFSFTLPEVLGDIQHGMGQVADGLRAGLADNSLVDRQRELEAELQSLLDALKTASQPAPPTNSQCQGGCCSNKFKLLAEVRMLHGMQQKVSRQTRVLRDRELSGSAVGEEIRAEGERLHVQQDRLEAIAERLRELTTPGYVRGEE